MIVDAWTTFRKRINIPFSPGHAKIEDKLIFQIDHAWLDEWPMIDALGQQVKLPPNCNVHITQDGIEFIREIDDYMAADVCKKESSPWPPPVRGSSIGRAAAC